MTALERVPARRIVAALSDAAARWADADFPPRVRLLDRIVERTGYSMPVVEYALDQIFFSITEPDLVRTITAELGSLECLDGMSAGRAALPAGRVAIVSSRTTIGVGIVPAVFALCAKCNVLVKDREDGLVRAFFASVCDELAEFGDAASAEEWSGERDAHELDRYDVVAAFATDVTLRTIRSKMRADARLLAYGAKASAGTVTAGALGNEADVRRIAERAARDVVLYDTEGCMSLHVVFVETGGSVTPAGFAHLLARGIEAAAVEFPPGAIDVGARARVAQARDLAAFRAASGSGGVYSDANASFLVLLDPPRAEPPPFLARSVAVFSVSGVEEANAYLRAHGIPLEAIAAAGEIEAAVLMAREHGAARICAFGDLQRPPLGNPHGGIGRISPFVRWMANE